MNTTIVHRAVTRALSALLLVGAPVQAEGPTRLPPILFAPNATGIEATYSTAGWIDLTNPFFQSLGGNGRACVTCHQPSAGWTVTPENVRARFEATDGTDPIFRTNDGSVSPNADVSTVEARRAAYAMLLDKGLIRVGLGVPHDAEFELVAVDDPYGHAHADELSLFRRPLPSVNLKFLSTVMWDGRETFTDAASSDCFLGTTTCFAPIHFDLSSQAGGATTGHAQAPAPTAEQREAIVALESSLFTAQIFDDAAGRLTAYGAKGGPKTLSKRDFYFGINDVVSNDYRTGALFDPNVMRLYDSWERGLRAPVGSDAASRVDARAAVFRGQTLFNSKPIRISGVAGLNDELGIPVLDGTCTTCHDTPHAGNHSIPVPPRPRARRRVASHARSPALHAAQQADAARWSRRPIRDARSSPASGRTSGGSRDRSCGRLQARAPYFHNGSARDLAAVVDFYNERFRYRLHRTGERRPDRVPANAVGRRGVTRQSAFLAKASW